MRIVVVGAGIVGCAIAHEVAARGAEVQLFDARGVGRGATRASAGILAPTTEGHVPALHSLAVRSLSMYDDFIRRAQDDARRSVEYERHGSLHAAFDDVHAGTLEEESRRLTEKGIANTLLDAAAARRLEPEISDWVTAALFVPWHGYVRAQELAEVLVSAAQAHGARVSIDRVVNIDAGNHGARVTTQAGTVDADAVILASGSWPVASSPEEAPPITPIRGQLVHLRLDERLGSHVIWGPDCYVVPWRDGSALVGATVEDVGFDERSTADGVRGLLDAAVHLVPALGHARLDEVRVGLRPKGGGELPIIGRSETMASVFYAMGHYRNGVLLAPLTAALIADLVLDGRERAELSLVKPGRTPEG